MKTTYAYKYTGREVPEDGVEHGTGGYVDIRECVSHARQESEDDTSFFVKIENEQTGEMIAYAGGGAVSVKFEGLFVKIAH